MSPDTPQHTPRPASSPARVTVPMLVATSWRAAPVVLRRFSIRIWIGAAVAATGAIVADFLGVWRDLGFVANLLAEVIGALAAAPIALLVVSQLAAYQSEEVARPRQEAQIRAARADLLVAAHTANNQITVIDAAVTAATDEFIEATRAAEGSPLADVQRAETAAAAMRSHLDPTERAMIERSIAQVQLSAALLRDALITRDAGAHDSDPARAIEIRDLAQAADDLRLALERHRRNMDEGYAAFGRPAWLNGKSRSRIDDLRRAAIDFLRSLEKMQQHCVRLEQLSADGAGPPEVTP